MMSNKPTAVSCRRAGLIRLNANILSSVFITEQWPGSAVNSLSVRGTTQLTSKYDVSLETELDRG